MMERISYDANNSGNSGWKFSTFYSPTSWLIFCLLFPATNQLLPEPAYTCEWSLVEVSLELWAVGREQTDEHTNDR